MTDHATKNNNNIDETYQKSRPLAATAILGCSHAVKSGDHHLEQLERSHGRKRRSRRFRRRNHRAGIRAGRCFDATVNGISFRRHHAGCHHIGNERDRRWIWD